MSLLSTLADNKYCVYIKTNSTKALFLADIRHFHYDWCFY